MSREEDGFQDGDGRKSKRYGWLIGWFEVVFFLWAVWVNVAYYRQLEKLVYPQLRRLMGWLGWGW